jgi:type II secretion system (T2SS) protein E
MSKPTSWEEASSGRFPRVRGNDDWMRIQLLAEMRRILWIWDGLGKAFLDHTVYCWNCSTPFNVFEAAWCGCSPTHPTKVCPFCYTCVCGAPAPYPEQFRRDLPQELLRELPALSRPRKKIGELLVERGRITDGQLAEILELQRATGVRLGDILVRQGMASREEVAWHLAEQQEMQVVEVDSRSLNLGLIQRVGPRLCLEHRFVPLDHQELPHNKVLFVAVAEPMPPAQVDQIGEKLGCTVYQQFAPPVQVRQALEQIKKLLGPGPPPQST